jgi:hypothetical protein
LTCLQEKEIVNIKNCQKKFFFFWWDWNLNLGLHTCKAVALLLEPTVSLEELYKSLSQMTKGKEQLLVLSASYLNSNPTIAT